MALEVFRYPGAAPGPRLLIFGSIHGNEKCGTLALRRIREELESGKLRLARGALTMVPMCNPRAFEENKRFIEENLNRVMFPHEKPASYERTLANELCPLIEDTDYFLDLHSMQAKGKAFSVLNKRSPESVAFCLALGADMMLEGWPEVFSQHPEVLACCTQTYADRFHIPNALIECGSHTDPEAVDVAYRAVLSALLHLQLADDSDLKNVGFEVRKKASEVITLKKVIFRESMEDRFAKEWKNFEEISRGEVIGTRHDGRQLLAESDGLIVFPNEKSPVGVEWYFWAEKQKS